MRRDVLLSLAVITLAMHDPLVHDLGTGEFEEWTTGDCRGRAR